MCRSVVRTPLHPAVAASPSSARLSPGTLRDESPFAASTWCCIPSGDPPGAAVSGLGLGGKLASALAYVVEESMEPFVVWLPRLKG